MKTLHIWTSGTISRMCQRRLPARARLSYREAECRQLTALPHRGPLELDRCATGSAEETNAVAEQDRADMHENLVDQVGLEALPGDVGAEHHHVAVVRRSLRDRHGLLY